MAKVEMSGLRKKKKGKISVIWLICYTEVSPV